jgi:hypothetical protein
MQNKYVNQCKPQSDCPQYQKSHRPNTTGPLCNTRGACFPYALPSVQTDKQELQINSYMSAEFLSPFLCHTSLSNPYLTVLSTFPSFFSACTLLRSDSLCKYRSKQPRLTKQKYRLCHDTRYFKVFPDVRLLCERPSKRTYSVNGGAMAQAVTRWPFIAATRVRSLVKSDTGTGVSLSSTVFPCHCESNNAQYSSSKLFLTRDRRVNPGDLPTKEMLFRLWTIFKKENNGTGAVYT